MKDYNHKAALVSSENRSAGVGPTRPQRAQGGGGDTASIQFSDIWDTIRRGKWIILGVTVLITAAVAAYTFTLPKVYEATSVVAIEPPSDNRSSNSMLRATASQSRGIAGELGTLQYSMAIATQVAEELRKTAEVSDANFPILTDEDGEPLPSGEVAKLLFEQVEFEELPMQNMIQINARSQKPEEASNIANLYAQEYEEYSRETSRASIAAARKFLQEQVKRQQEELNQLEGQWASFARSNETVIQGESGQQLVERYQNLSTRQSELEFRLKQERTNLGMLQSQLEQFEPNVRSNVQIERQASSLNSEISALDERIANLKVRAEEFYVNDPSLRGNEERVPELAELKRQIGEYEKRRQQLTEELVAMQSEVGGGQGAEGALGRVQDLRNRVQETKRTISQLEAELSAVRQTVGSYRGQLQGVPTQAVEQQQLDRKLEQAGRLYDILTDELQSHVIAEQSELGYVNQVRKAYVPTLPVSPNFQQNIVLGILLGLGFGIGLAFMRQAANNQIHTPEDLQEKGFSLVGVIPRMDREIKASFKGEERVDVEGHELSTSLMPLLNPWSPISENYRLIRTNLQYANLENGAPKVLMVTSPEKGDGKTTTAVNLAITMAQSGRRTLLVDADLRRPNTHKLLGMPLSPGLADYLNSTNGQPISRVIGKAPVDKLSYVPAGRTDIPPAEMLGSGRMEHFLNELRAQYDIIVVDTPPVLAVSDPVLMAPLCDATLMVISADRTNLQALEVAQRTLNAVGVPISGTVFNRFDAQQSSGYGYGYRYDYEYGEEEDTAIV